MSLLTPNVLPFTPSTGLARYDGNSLEYAAAFALPTPETKDDNIFSAVDAIQTRGAPTVGPTVLTLSPTTTGLTLVLDQPAYAGSPSIVAGPVGSPTVTGDTQVNPNSIRVDYTLSVPTITSIKPSVTDMEMDFSAPVTIGNTIIPGPPGSLMVTSQSQTAADVITLGYTIPSKPAPSLLSAVCTTNHIDLTWADAHSLTVAGAMPSSYTITTGTGAAVSVVGVSFNAGVLTLTTTDHTTGALYSIAFVADILHSLDSVANSADDIGYTGNGVAPALYTAAMTSFVAVRVTYTDSMDTVTATDKNNYSIPGLTVNSVTQITPAVYQLNTSVMTPDTAYVLTVTGVLDAAGNPI